MTDVAPDIGQTRFRAPAADEITLLTQELSWMVEAGVPLGRAFDILAAEASGRRMGPVLTAIRARLRAGSGLAEAMRQCDGVFPEAYLRLVALAEHAGTLPLVLSRLHAGRARAQALRRKVGSALVYPAFLLLVALAAMATIGLAVVPQMRAILPPEPMPDGGDSAIRTLIGISDWIAAHWPVALAAVMAGVLGLWFLVRLPVVRRGLAGLLAVLPGIGPLVVSARLADVTGTLAMLTEAGLPLSESLRLARQGAAAPALAGTLERMEAALRAGQDVTLPLRDDPAIPPLLVTLLRVGQETGNLGLSLRQAAAVFEERTRLALDRALVLMEPAIILVISGGVGAMIYVVIGALMSVNSLFV